MKLTNYFITMSFISITLLSGSSIEYSTPKETTLWLQKARFGLIFDWSARVNFETDILDSYDGLKAKGLQKGSLYGSVEDENGNPTGLKKWEIWNPTKFSPKKWMDMVELSGANYFIYTINDRYGFLNLDSPATTIDSAATKLGVDVASALAQEATRRDIPYLWHFQQYAGIDFILGSWIYFKSRWTEGINTYAQYRKSTLFHLIKNKDIYGKCMGIYFSGNAGGIVPSEHPAREGEDPEYSDQTHSTYLKELLDAQPWMAISSEFYLKKDPLYNPMINLDRFKFRNYNTKPNKFDGSHSVIFSLESDLDGWAGVSKEDTRTSQEAIYLIVQAAGHNENLLLRVTPDNKGNIPLRQQDVLTNVGEWMQKYSKSIKNTYNGPYLPGAWGVSTRHANTIYIHILQHSKDGVYTLEALPQGIKSVKLLNTNEDIAYSNTNGKLTLHIPKNISSNRNIVDAIVQIQYQDNIDTTKFSSLSKNRWKEPISTDADIEVSQTSKLRNRDSNPTVLLSKLIDSKGKSSKNFYPRTYWSAPEPGETPAIRYPVTVQINLNGTEKIGAISILEKNSRIKTWHIDYQDTNGDWKTIYKGENEHLAFFDWKLQTPIETSSVRLVIEESFSKAPQLRFFRLFKAN